MKKIHYTDRYLLNPHHRNRFRNRCGRNRIAGGHQSGKNEYRIAGTRTSGPARDGF